VTNLTVVFLGTGGSWPTPQRNLPAIGIKFGSEVLLFDCGEGTQRQIMQTSLSFMKISKIFITHFHGDHFLGLPGLIQSMALNDRSQPLHIYGPKGIEDLVSRLVSLGYFGLTYDIHANEVKDGDILEFKKYRIRVLRADHTVPALAYVFEERERRGKFDRRKAIALGVPEGPLFGKLQRGECIEVHGRIIRPEDVLGPPRKGRKIVYSGDTRPLESIAEASKDADLLIHDSTLASDLSDTAHEFGHSTAKEAAIIAKKAKARMLALFHISPRYAEDDEVLEKEAREVFENVFVARDFMELDIRYQN